MPTFYEQLEYIDKIIGEDLVIKKLDKGYISVNNHRINTNIQLEMLTPEFFTGTSETNPTINAYRLMFQKMGILPKKAAETPIIRDIPLRTYTKNEQAKKQHKLFALFLEKNILTNQWNMLFSEEYATFRIAIKRCFKEGKALERKRITTTPDGTPLASGGFDVELHSINGINLWIRKPEGDSEQDISAAIDKSLNDTENTNQIIQSLKYKLLTKNKIAFNIRGVSNDKLSQEEIQGTDLGGGHQHLLLLDRTKKTIYAINNTRQPDVIKPEDIDDASPRAFKAQIELFLKSLGDTNDYKFEYIQGKSRQPDDETYLSQICNVSQFCHYAAILSGIGVHELHETVPAKVTTLMYLIQYAFSEQDKDLFKILADLIVKINKQLEVNPPPVKQVAFISQQNNLDYVKTTFKGHVILKVIERLERRSKSLSPYWYNSQNKLNQIVTCLLSISKEQIDVELAKPESALSIAVNMHRLPQFKFFSCCVKNSPVKSRIMINEHHMTNS